MIRHSIHAAILIVLSCLGGCGRPSLVADTVGLSEQKLAALDARVQHHIDSGQIAGAVVLLMRDGNLAHLKSYGHRDREADVSMTDDTIFRIASMTKPIVSAAVMMLHEQGKLRLDDPVQKFIPSFADAKVLTDAGQLVPAKRPVTVHDLLTHTAGVAYGFSAPGQLGEHYRTASISSGLVQTPGTIAEAAERLGKLPLAHQPGEKWTYGLSIDVLGRVVEVASGRPLDVYLQQQIFKPLKMRDTHFFLPESKLSRLAALYQPGEGGKIVRTPPGPQQAGNLRYSGDYHHEGPRTYFSGGAGLVSTAHDYARFLQMMLNGGELDGVRLLKPATVELMTRDHIAPLAVPFAGHGDGFGYGFGVVTPRGDAADPAPAGTYSWGGIFHTYFWVDPQNELVAILMTQLYPFNQSKLRAEFKQLVYEALEP